MTPAPPHTAPVLSTPDTEPSTHPRAALVARPGDAAAWHESFQLLPPTGRVHTMTARDYTAPAARRDAPPRPDENIRLRPRVGHPRPANCPGCSTRRNHPAAVLANSEMPLARSHTIAG